MTTWTDGPGPRGVGGLLRAWVAVVTHPRRFFREAVRPGDQAPGLVFAMAVVLVEESTRLALAPGGLPPVVGDGWLSTVLLVAVAVLLVAPLALHLLAALVTLGLVVVADRRAGISETVQVVAYAAAPCVLAGPPVPAIRVVVAAYGAALLVVGLSTVHGVGTWRASLAGAVPAALLFGYGFRGFDAVAAVLARWYII